MNTGFAGSERSYTCVTREARYASWLPGMYAMPLLHSHSFLWVLLNWPNCAISAGFSGTVTSYTSWRESPKVRSR